MKEHPILFTGPMVNAILNGRKTQTRRAVKPLPSGACIRMEDLADRPDYYSACGWCKYGESGDHLWVKETHQFHTTGAGYRVTYRADQEDRFFDPDDEQRIFDDNHWRPSIFMPRWASRITLEITNIRVERVRGISEEDAMAEGAENQKHDHVPLYSHTAGFERLWDSINAERTGGIYSWERNPWVWVIEFKRV